MCLIFFKVEIKECTFIDNDATEVNDIYSIINDRCSLLIIDCNFECNIKSSRTEKRSLIYLTRSFSKLKYQFINNNVTFSKDSIHKMSH